MGSKQSVVVATEWSFFQITFLGTKNHWKNDIFEQLTNLTQRLGTNLTFSVVLRFQIWIHLDILELFDLFQKFRLKFKNVIISMIFCA